jgi:hypothetical protein
MRTLRWLLRTALLSVLLGFALWLTWLALGML